MMAEDEKAVHNDGESQPATSPRQAILALLDRELPTGQLDENTRRVEQPVVGEPHRASRALVFQLFGEVLGLAAADVDRVTRVATVHGIPHRTNRIVRGIANIGGELQLCGSLADLLDLTAPPAQPAQETHKQRMIVLGRGRNRWAFIADEVPGVATLVLDSTRRPPVTVEHARNCCVEAVVSTGERKVTLLKTDRILSGFRAALQ